MTPLTGYLVTSMATTTLYLDTMLHNLQECIPTRSARKSAGLLHPNLSTHLDSLLRASCMVLSSNYVDSNVIHLVGSLKSDTMLFVSSYQGNTLDVSRSSPNGYRLVVVWGAA
eukprot:10426848-Ditylum_brightwellii.AAC.1